MVIELTWVIALVLHKPQREREEIVGLPRQENKKREQEFSVIKSCGFFFSSSSSFFWLRRLNHPPPPLLKQQQQHAVGHHHMCVPEALFFFIVVFFFFFLAFFRLFDSFPIFWGFRPAHTPTRKRFFPTLDLMCSGVTCV